LRGENRGDIGKGLRVQGMDVALRNEVVSLMQGGILEEGSPKSNPWRSP